MKLKIEPARNIQGTINIPGDKSITHRSVILSSIAEGKSIIKGFLKSEDCLKTLNAFNLMGVDINKIGSGNFVINGVGLYGLEKPVKAIDCGNSGTCMRLLTGLLSAQNFYSVLTGDNSLTNRPMDRIITPLTKMGAKIWAENNRYAPLGIRGQALHGIYYDSPIASAQVKSSLLLAGLYAEGEMVINEPLLSRDHSERMLEYFGIKLERNNNQVRLPDDRIKKLMAREIEIPGDISSAAFFITAALIVPGSEVLIKNVGINPTRSGIIDVLEKMEADIEILNKRTVNCEPVADLKVKSSRLRGILISGEIIPRLIDEIPIIAVLASQAEGETVIRDAGELRVKETDRIKTVVEGLKKLNVKIEELEDGMIINGPTKIKGNVKIESYWDHRVAMSMAIAGLLADNNIVIDDSECINTSFPEFMDILQEIYH